MGYLKSMRLLVMGVLFLALAGCGGGGGDSSGALAVSATLDADNTNGSAVATYTPAQSDKSPQGVVINFSTDRPDVVALSNTSQSVGTDGKATVSFRAVTVTTDTKVTIIAETGGLRQTSGVTVKGTGGGGAPPPVVSATPQSITFVSASPTQLNLKGFGTSTNPETSIVTFLVKDTAGNPVPGVTVTFTPDTTVGGITCIPGSSTTDSNGQATTIVSSGTMATPVRITAKVVVSTSLTLSAQSGQLVVAGGPPDQTHLSIALSDLNPEAWNIDGNSVTVTARLADHYANPVSDGTAVYFTTDGGSIQSSCTTTGGACSVTWTSQNPRPVTPGINPGVATILAYAVGEEGFTDLNNNMLADGGTCSPVTLSGVGSAQKCGEFFDTPDAFRDDNFNGIRDANEPFFNLAGTTTYNGPDSKYEGSFAPSGSTAPHSKYIFYNSKLIMATSGASITASPTSLSGPGEVVVTVRDRNGNTMPSKTTIDIKTTVGTLSGAPLPYIVPLNTGTGVDLPIFITASTSPTLQSGVITVTVTSPSGLVTTGFIPISGMF